MSQQDPKLSIEHRHVTVNAGGPIGYEGMGTEDATRICRALSY